MYLFSRTIFQSFNVYIKKQIMKSYLSKAIYLGINAIDNLVFILLHGICSAYLPAVSMEAV